MLKTLIFCLTCSLVPSLAWAVLIEFEASDFTVTTNFSNVQTFKFSIDVAEDLVPGGVYLNPEINSIEYNVSGTLDNTPSRFPAFALVRSMTGEEFYAQGSEMVFQIAVSADLTDGLQITELEGAGPVFLFNAREVNTGRYHPPFFQLSADGSGIIQNSNNKGGINPASMEEVIVDFGDEFVSSLGFTPALLTLTGPIPSVVYEDGFETP